MDPAILDLTKTAIQYLGAPLITGMFAWLGGKQKGKADALEVQIKVQAQNQAKQSNTQTSSSGSSTTTNIFVGTPSPPITQTIIDKPEDKVP